MQIENIPKKELGGPTIENEHHNRKPSSKTVKRSLDLETDKTGYKKPVAISFTTVKTDFPGADWTAPEDAPPPRKQILPPSEQEVGFDLSLSIKKKLIPAGV
ncbi:hypothetical protein RUM44_010514 [Polyplax serrata]|uniref:Uncharacterized protein n=1 Tax=Polyplax serrata TaxID=468196 RepID=A0ABR1AVR6_POLSC